MIYGVGVDIIEINRIKNSLTRFANHFEEKVFTPGEINYCRSKAEPSIHYAGRFAIKEAVMKSLGKGMGQNIGWKDIEVKNIESGQPVLQVYGKCKTLFDQLNLKKIHISISHDKSHAVGQAIAEQ
ncbi:MAG: holo-ACP synthase [Nitrospinales bacterium]